MSLPVHFVAREIPQKNQSESGVFLRKVGATERMRGGIRKCRREVGEVRDDEGGRA